MMSAVSVIYNAVPIVKVLYSKLNMIYEVINLQGALYCQGAEDEFPVSSSEY